MKLTISPNAYEWFTAELDIKSGDGIRFFGKYGGATNVHTGFTTGMAITAPSIKTLANVTERNITFFIDETDDWFFHGYDLAVGFDEKMAEPTYFYTENGKN